MWSYLFLASPPFYEERCIHWLCHMNKCQRWQEPSQCFEPIGKAQGSKIPNLGFNSSFAVWCWPSGWSLGSFSLSSVVWLIAKVASSDVNCSPWGPQYLLCCPVHSRHLTRSIEWMFCESKIVFSLAFKIIICIYLSYSPLYPQNLPQWECRYLVNIYLIKAWKNIIEFLD